MTEKEKMVMDSILEKGSNFNFCKVHLESDWDEQCFGGEEFWAFADVKDYGCGMSKQSARAIFGSLQKKKLITLLEDDPDTWLVIDKENFNNIKREYSKA